VSHPLGGGRRFYSSPSTELTRRVESTDWQPSWPSAPPHNRPADLMSCPIGTPAVTPTGSSKLSLRSLLRLEDDPSDPSSERARSTGGRGSGGRAPESAPPKSCSVKSRRSSTECNRTAISANSSLSPSSSRGSPAPILRDAGADIFPSIHWHSTVPAAPMVPPMINTARTTMMISGCISASPDFVNRATTATHSLAVRHVSFGPTKFGHQGFRL